MANSWLNDEGYAEEDTKIPNGQYVLVEVVDTGTGIPKALLQKIFEPFFTTRNAQGGRGVGLTISRAMVERHGGQIIVQSPIHQFHGKHIGDR